MSATLMFPVNSYQKHCKGNVEKFDFTAMILTAVNRFCFNLVFSELINENTKYSHSFKYKFSEFEIKDLANQKPEKIHKKHIIKTNYEFSLSATQKNYKGKIEIVTTLKNNGSFEKSFYEIKITLSSEEALKIYPYFLNKKGQILILSEFFQKIWRPIWLELSFIGKTAPTKENNYSFTNGIPILSEQIIENLKLPPDKQNKVKDAFSLCCGIWFNYAKEKEWVLITTDDLLTLRNIKKNKNTKKFESGYKFKKRTEIHSTLNLLNQLGLLIVRELTPFTYALTLPYKLRSLKQHKIPLRIIQYSNKTQILQKNIARFLLEKKHSQIQIKKIYSKCLNLFCSNYAPSQIREFFETALDNIVYDAIIKDWHYTHINEDDLCSKNWFEKWLTLSIKIYYW